MKNNKWRSLIYSVTLLFTSASALGQTISKEQILKFKVASVSEFNDKDELEKYAYYNTDGNPIHEANMFSPSIDLIYEGKLLKTETAMSFDGPLQSISKYTYNSKNQLSIITKTDAKHVLQSKKTFEYDSKGNIVKQISWSPDDSLVTDYTYKENLLIETAMSQNSLVRDRMIYYTYDIKGKIIEKKETLYHGASATISIYTYDTSGNLIEIKEDLENGAIITSYKYDSKGLLESTTWKSTLESKSHKNRFVIEYY